MPALVIARTGSIPVTGSNPQVRIASQSITAGQTGSLERVEFQLAQGAGQGLLGIGLVDGDWSLNQSLEPFFFVGVASQFLPTTLQTTDQGVLFAIDLSGSGYRVQPGRVFSAVFTFQPFAQTGWASLVTGIGTSFVPGQQPTFQLNNYAGGTLSMFVNGSSQPSILNGDVGLRTFVNTSAIPEPSSWMMLIAGFFTLGVALRRPRRKMQRVRKRLAN